MSSSPDEVLGAESPPQQVAPKLKGCDSCKLRKTKCVRNVAGSTSCTQCSKNGIRCTVTPVARKPYTQRKGGRVELAKSDHAVLFEGVPGADAIPSLTALNLAPECDLIEYGQRRLAVCNQLRERAVRLAWETGAMAVASPENAAACSLLEKIVERSDPLASKPYGVAFATHARTLSHRGAVPNAEWKWLILLDAYASLQSNTASSFTDNDYRTLCGPIPMKLSQALAEIHTFGPYPSGGSASNDPIPEDSREHQYLISFIRALTLLSRECVDSFTGVAAQHEPFDEPRLRTYFSSLEDTHLAFEYLERLLEARFANTTRLQYMFDNDLGADAGARHIFKVILSSHALPVFRELSRRIASLDAMLSSSPFPSVQTEYTDIRSQQRAWYASLQRDVEAFVVRDVQVVCDSIVSLPSLAVLTHMSAPPLRKWAEYLLECKVVEEGGLITKAQRRFAMETVLSGVRSMGWSWTGGESVAESLEGVLRGSPSPALSEVEEDEGGPIPNLFSDPAFGLDTPALAEIGEFVWPEGFGVGGGGGGGGVQQAAGLPAFYLPDLGFV
ncbi:hypothetical protein RQP46_011410 [Phenoliferia psychrophenolica]